MEDRASFVYMLASRRNGTLYPGVTSNLGQRVWEHKQGFVEGFTKRYRTHLLVWYEVHDSAYAAITREKQLKRWNRAWKIRIVEETKSILERLVECVAGLKDAGSPPSRGRQEE
jgi:putative endonuclease